MNNPFKGERPSRGAEGAALDALRDRTTRERISAGDPEAARRLLADLIPLAPIQDDPNIVALMDAAIRDPDHETSKLRAALEILADIPALKLASDFANEDEPEPVLWRDDDSGRFADSVLSVGEVALLSGAGGLGKSFVALALAHAAATAGSGHTRGRRARFASACGLRIRPGPSVLLSFEDSAVRIAARLKRIHSAGIEGLPVYVVPEPCPLWQADPEHRGESRAGHHWSKLWAGIRDIKPSLVIVDPASAALEGVSTSESSPVRAFLRALASEAAAGGFGCLVVAHDTKAARNESRSGGDPGSGAVAGSSAWWDAARGVLYFRPDKSKSMRLLQCVKSNYGSAGWEATLEPGTDPAGRFAGYRLSRPHSEPSLPTATDTLSGDIGNEQYV